MRSKVIGFVLAGFLMAILAAPLSVDAKVDVPQMMNIQKHLKALDYNCKCTGKMDEATTEAVKQFQKDHGLKVDGIFTPETMDAIMKAWDEKVKKMEQEHSMQ